MMELQSNVIGDEDLKFENILNISTIVSPDVVKLQSFSSLYRSLFGKLVDDDISIIGKNAVVFDKTKEKSS